MSVECCADVTRTGWTSKRELRGKALRDIRPLGKRRSEHRIKGHLRNAELGIGMEAACLMLSVHNSHTYNMGSKF